MANVVDPSKPSDLSLALARAAVQELGVQLDTRRLGWYDLEGPLQDEVEAALVKIVARYVEMGR